MKIVIIKPTAVRLIWLTLGFGFLLSGSAFFFCLSYTISWQKSL
jgi:hypothetical protein